MTNAALRLSARKWGVMTRYLQRFVCDPALPHNMNVGEISWDDAVKRFDAERLAYCLHRMNAGYYFLSVMQGDKYMISPNKTYDSIAGTKPGEACATRDLIADIIKALSKYDIDFGLYFTGYGPYKDNVIGAKFGFFDPMQQVSEDSCRKWAAVLEEYALRYGDGIKAWWVDTCYRELGYNDALYSIYYDAIKKGNPDAAAAFNNGQAFWPYMKNYANEDFIAAETSALVLRPQCQDIDGANDHVIAPIGEPLDEFDHNTAWGAPGLIQNKEYIASYIRYSNTKGTMVTLDAMINIDGSFDPEQEAAMIYVGKNV